MSWLLAFLALAALLVTFPLTGWSPVVRLPALVVPVLALLAVSYRPWRWDRERWRTVYEWRPTRQVVWTAAALVAMALFWIVLTRFRSGEINAVDFTVYFDRPTYQTLHGRPLFVETADVPSFSHRSQLAVHAFWAMLPLATLYALWASPLWLLALSVIAVVAGGLHVFRIVEKIGGSGWLASAAALAFVLNDNTARTLNYGFHAEVLYAWFVPWLLDAGLTGRRVSFLFATAACVMVKEDACLVLLAACTALALHRSGAWTRGDRWLYLALPIGAALLNLFIYYTAIVPALNPDGRTTYASFWANYGATPLEALLGMLQRPGDVLARTASSGFFTHVIVPHLFLPLIGWRWTLGILPMVLIYGSSANAQLREFGLYYSIVLVPFLAIGAADGALTVARWAGGDRPRAQAIGATILLAGALIVGSTTAGYSLRPWKPELARVAVAIKALPAESTILVQSGLYPFAGYDARVQLLTPETRAAAAGTTTVLLLAPRAGAYPFTRAEIDAMLALPPVPLDVPGLVAVRPQ